MWLGPVHEPGALARSSAYRKHKSPGVYMQVQKHWDKQPQAMRRTTGLEESIQEQDAGQFKDPLPLGSGQA